MTAREHIWDEKGYAVVRIKTSITIDKEFLEWIRKKVEDRVFASRSHAIEYAIKHLMDEDKLRSKEIEESSCAQSQD